MTYSGIDAFIERSLSPNHVSTFATLSYGCVTTIAGRTRDGPTDLSDSGERDGVSQLITAARGRRHVLRIRVVAPRSRRTGVRLFA